jgi:hypothetical protein
MDGLEKYQLHPRASQRISRKEKEKYQLHLNKWRVRRSKKAKDDLASFLASQETGRVEDRHNYGRKDRRMD